MHYYSYLIKVAGVNNLMLRLLWLGSKGFNVVDSQVIESAKHLVKLWQIKMNVHLADLNLKANSFVVKLSA